MPHPVIGPMEHPVAGVQTHRRASKPTPLLHGDTSLKLSDTGSTPVLEAHPGSPVDLSNARRPSLAAALASARSYGSDQEMSGMETPRTGAGKQEEGIGRDGVAAKVLVSMLEHREQREFVRSPRRTPHLAGTHPFFIPAKVPEDEEVSVTTTSVQPDDNASFSTTMDSIDMDFPFEADDGEASFTVNPLANESRSSLATTDTTSTLMEDNRYGNFTHGPLTVNTSVASSSTSMVSSSASTYSASPNPSDIYGWEEELDRKSSTDNYGSWESDQARRVPSGGRTYGTRREFRYKHTDGKRKSLLYRVLNISGRRGSDDSGTTSRPEVISATIT